MSRRKKDSKIRKAWKVRQRKQQDNSKSNNHTILLRNAHVWTPNGFRDGTILIENSRIRKIAKRIVSQTDTVIDGSGLVAIPGLVDVHVHLRDLALAYKEDFTTGTAAAAAGGFTSILDMPNTKPPTDSPTRMVEKQKIAQGLIHVNVGFHAAAIEDQESIEKLAHYGAFSLKLYMPRPISKIDIENDNTILQIMRTAARSSLPVTVHAEDPDFFIDEPPRSFYEMATYRRIGSETVAVDRILELAEKSRCQIHFCHVTLGSSLDSINSLQSPILSSEVTPHHLLLSNEALLRKKWKAWMVPPLRPIPVREQLFNAAIVNGEATVIGSDHAPHSLKEKNAVPLQSPPGIPGLETTLPLMLTLVNKGRMTFSTLLRLLCFNPRRIFGLSSQLLKTGSVADIVLVDLKKKMKVDPAKFFSKAHYSPFEGFETHGAVHSTIVNGNLVYSEGEIVEKPGTGRVLQHGQNDTY